MSEHGSVLEIPECLCGSTMIPFDTKPDHFWCLNCDVVRKLPSMLDKLCKQKFKTLLKKWYPDQGSQNAEDIK